MYGGIYCFLCQDYIYDKDIEIIAKEEQRKAWKMQGLVFRSSVSLVVSSPASPAPCLSGGGGRSPQTCLLPPASSGGPREAGAEPTVSGPVLLPGSSQACDCHEGFSPDPSTQGLRPRRCWSLDR